MSSLDSLFTIHYSLFTPLKKGHDSLFTIHHSRRQQDGFTLIEMLVVMLIMGLLLGLVSAIARPSERSPLRLEAERLAQLLELAVTEAQLTGRPIGWTSDGAGYRFARWFRDTGWSEIRDDDLLRPRTLPGGIQISGMRVEAARAQGAMRLEFGPYGAMPAFTVDLSSGGERYSVAGSPIGEIRALAPEGAGNGASMLR